MPRYLPLSLMLLRVGVFVVFLMWTLDKLFNPEHTAQIFAGVYKLEGLGVGVFYILGALQLILIIAFVLGVLKTWTYGAITVFHGIATLAPFGRYLDPFDNLLFFAAWPMLASCIALFLLRDYDKLTLGR
jgi:putative oxidoreductase